VNTYRKMFNESLFVQRKKLVATFGGNVVVLLQRPRRVPTSAMPSTTPRVARRLVLSPSRRPPTPDGLIPFRGEQFHHQSCPASPDKHGSFTSNGGNSSSGNKGKCAECGVLFPKGSYSNHKYCKRCWIENRLNRSRPPPQFPYGPHMPPPPPRMQYSRNRENSGGESSCTTSYSCSSSDEGAPLTHNGLAMVARDMLMLPCCNRGAGCPFTAASADELRRHQDGGCVYACNCPWNGCTNKVWRLDKVCLCPSKFKISSQCCWILLILLANIISLCALQLQSPVDFLTIIAVIITAAILESIMSTSFWKMSLY